MLSVMEITNLFGGTFSIIWMSALFAASGNAMLGYFLPLPRLPASLTAASGFFLSMSIFISLWCFLETILHSARAGLFASVAILMVIALRGQGLRPTFQWIMSIIKNPTLFLFFGLICPFFFVVSRVNPDVFDIDAHLGSGSTMLYFNKAVFISKHDLIPAVTNSIGQTMLAAITILFGFSGSGILALSVWTYVNLVVLGCLFFGIFRFLSLPRLTSGVASFLMLFGSTAFSLFPVNVVDSGVPFNQGMYAHCHLTVGIFCVALFLFYHFLSGQLRRSYLIYPLVVLLISSWVITSPENIVIGMPALALVAIYMLWKGIWSMRQVAIGTAVIIPAIFLGMTQGGLLSPERFRDIELERTIPGWQPSPVGQPFSFSHVGLDYSVSIAPNMFGLQFPSGQRFHSDYDGASAVLGYDFKGSFKSPTFALFNQQGVKNIAGFFLIIETEIWLAIRLFFFPILGMIWLLTSGNKHRSLATPSAQLRPIAIAALVTLTGGLLLSVIPYQTGLKWPFTRFLLPGIAPAQMCFCIMLIVAFRQLKFRQFSKFVVSTTVVGALTFGNVVSTMTRAVANFGALNPAGEDLATRARRMISTSDYVIR
jgi:hypothetical protein